MTDRGAATVFALAILDSLDSFGHMSWCRGLWDREPCNYEACRQARAAVHLATVSGYLPIPASDIAATRQALTRALDAALGEGGA